MSQDDSSDLKNLFYKFRFPILILLIGIICVGGGIILKSLGNPSSTKVEVLSESIEAISTKEITVEIAGEVIAPGVYELSGGARVNDLLVLAGGFSGSADRVWTDKYLNRAAKLTDGQKVFIPKKGDENSNQNYQSFLPTDNKTGGDQTTSPQNSLTGVPPVNINTASLSELDKLPGIGPVYGQKIIEQRPYSTTQELVSKGAIKQSLYNKIKELITIY